MKTIMCTFVLTALAGIGLAQEPQTRVIEVEKAKAAEDVLKLNNVVIRMRDAHVEVNKAMTFVHELSAGPIVKNAPYSAEAVTETVQQLFDGNRIVQRETQKLYRDGQGRERREQSAPMALVSITDPVAGESYTLHPDGRTAEKRHYAGGMNIYYAATGASTGKKIAYNTIGNGAAGAKLFIASVNGETEWQTREESLGTRIVEGVQAEGSRSVTTIPAGAIGNDRAIEIIDERWFSPDLQMTVMTRHADPRSGETTYKLTNIQRVEQVRSLFEIPTSYSINDTANAGGGRGVVRK